MWRWLRLFWLLAALGAAGVLIVHYQTSVVTSGYKISVLIEEREGLKEQNRTLRIDLGRASVPSQVRESFKVMTAPEEETTPSGVPEGANPAAEAGRKETKESGGPDIGGGDDE